MFWLVYVESEMNLATQFVLSYKIHARKPVQQRINSFAPRSTSTGTSSMKRRFVSYASSSQGVWSRLVKEADGNPIAVHVECER